MLTHAPTLRYLLLATLPVLAAACLQYPDAGGGDSGSTAPPEDTRGTLAGTVLDSAGAPISGAHVTTVPRGYEATTDGDGAFEIGLLPPGSYQVVAAAEGLESATSASVAVEAGQESAVEVRLGELPAGGVLRVRLRGPDDNPLVGATVTTSAGAAGTTDEAGELVLTGVAGDAVQVVLGEDERTWPYVVEGLAITDAGGEQLAFQLSGRPPAGTSYQGNIWCTSCHADAADGHAGTHHADALSESLPTEVRARFTAGETVDLGRGATAILGVDGSSPVVTLVDSAGGSQDWPVQGLIGSAASRAVPWVDDGDQAWPLPFAWIAADADRGPDYPDAQARWVPYQVDRWLDGAGALVALDPSDSAEAGCLPCHATGFTLTVRGDGGVDMAATNGAGRYNDAGVQCESCHGPGQAHSTTTKAEERAFLITSPQLLQADRANEVCGQCHSRAVAVGTGLPYPHATDGMFQPGQVLADYATPDPLRWDNGTSAYGRQQLDDLKLSPHGPEGALDMRCTDCHAAHGVGDDGVAWPHQGRLNPDDNSLCLSCHLDRTFGGDADGPAQHAAHARYGPEEDHQTGRCATCHMPATAATVAFSERSGAGDVSSHLYTIHPPQDTVDAFDAEGASTLPVGSFPIHGCAECHDYADWLWTVDWSADFPGPVGDPTLRETHVDYQDAYAEKYE